VRISLHVLAAAVWVGGQFVLAGLLPTLRSLASDAPTRVARAFARLSWPAFAVLLATGIWNDVAESSAQHQDGTWMAVLMAKMSLVVVAGFGAWIHSRPVPPRTKGISAGVGLIASVGALVLGVALAG
jgi:putative copper export protein